MTIDLWSIVQFVAQAALASGAALLLVSTKVGEKLFSHHLERKLARFKHDHDEAIEELRAELSHLSDRGKHSNQREFDALSAIWDKFIDAFLSTNSAVVRYMEFPDLNKMTAEEVASFLNSTDFSEAQKDQVSAAADKNKLYSRVVELRLLNRAQNDIYDTRLLIRKQGIFVPTPLVSQFEEALKILHAAQIERYMEFRHEGSREHKAQTDLLNNGEKKVADLAIAVRARLLRTD